MIKIKKNNELQILNDYLATQIKGGNLSSAQITSTDFTRIYDRKSKKQEGWEDDSNGTPVRRIPD